MSADRDPIDALLASIVDGGRVDWQAAERALGATEAARLAALRAVSRIAEFSRFLQSAPSSADAPERWGDLVLLERLGEGSHATVHRAWDRVLQREVALKLVRAEGADTALLEEGRAAARIRHPHVVTVHGIDRRDGRVGLWMELVRGATLEEEVRRHGALDPDAVLRLGLEIGQALEAVHGAGVIHRDVKPSNLVRDAQGRHVLTDFGLGLRSADAHAFSSSGTPMYMAPEHLAGAKASESSDVYALGMVLWFAATGRHPFAVETFDELVAAARRGPGRLRDTAPGFPATLASIIERAIAPDPAARFRSARELVTALEARRSSAASRSRRATMLSLAIIVAIAVIVVFASRGDRARRAPAPAIPARVEAPASGATYAVEAVFLRRDRNGSTPLVTGDRVRPGDRLSLEVRATRPAWIYVLDEDEAGERFLLFPQPRFDLSNPVPAESTLVLPGAIEGRENAWTVTSAGGREHLLVVASPTPVAEIEADLSRIPKARPGRPIQYAAIGTAAIERLRGVGGVSELPASTPRVAPRSRAFDRFKVLAGRESGIRGVWVRQIVLENPR